MNTKLITLSSTIKMPGMQLPTKSTLIHIEDKNLIISPLPDLVKFKDQYKDFEPITDIIAPSGFHHLGVKKVCALYPHAKTWGVPILKSKRKDIQWDYLISESWSFSDTLQAIPLEGMPNVDEVVFYYKPTQSLIVTDLCFNHIHGSGLGYWIIFHLFGTYKRFAISQFFLKFVKDKKAFKNSIDKILSLDFQEILIPHGENVTKNAKDKLVAALRERKILD